PFPAEDALRVDHRAAQRPAGRARGRCCRLLPRRRPGRMRRRPAGVHLAAQQNDGGLRDRKVRLSMSLIVVRDLSVRYGSRLALQGVDMDVEERQITALIGPSGCGKSTFLRCLNRMNDTIPGARAQGEVHIDGMDMYAPGTDVVKLRMRVGMVFQRPNPFPQSIFDNVAFGPRVLGTHRRGSLDEVVERSLRSAELWDEVKDSLRQDALSLSL